MSTNLQKHIQAVKPNERNSVITGKRSGTPKRIPIAFRVKLETKETLEKLSGQLNLSQTLTIEMIVDYFSHTSDLEVARIKLETQENSLKDQLLKTQKKLKKLNL
ncbi:MAG TPA: hypothetical protein EYN67_15275 [Flavobacteriales bacterium]|nr:hypothetical protein [Flavobacteriales bacterium]